MAEMALICSHRLISGWHNMPLENGPGTFLSCANILWYSHDSCTHRLISGWHNMSQDGPGTFLTRCAVTHAWHLSRGVTQFMTGEAPVMTGPWTISNISPQSVNREAAIWTRHSEYYIRPKLYPMSDKSIWTQRQGNYGPTFLPVIVVVNYHTLKLYYSTAYYVVHGGVHISHH